MIMICKSGVRLNNPVFRPLPSDDANAGFMLDSEPGGLHLLTFMLTGSRVFSPELGASK